MSCYFSKNYEDARQKFRHAANECGAQLGELLSPRA